MQGNLPTLESSYCELALIKRTLPLHSRTSSALYPLCEKKNYKQKTYFRRTMLRKRPNFSVTNLFAQIADGRLKSPWLTFNNVLLDWAISLVDYRAV